MSHFQSDCEAIVVYSYADRYGGDNIETYTVYLKGQEEVSWYYEYQLILIEHGCFNKLEEWRSEDVLIQ